MKKKGFTLIELLAVIIILAIIALIAIPIVMNLIEKARIKKYISEENAMERAAKNYFVSDIMDGNEGFDRIELADLVDNNYIKEIKDSGKKGKCEGHVIVDNNTFNACLKCSNYQTKDSICDFPLPEYISAKGYDENPGVICGKNKEDYDNSSKCYIKSVEDLISFSILGNENKDFTGKTIYLQNSLDITDDKSYNEPNTSKYGDLNNDGKIESLKEEMMKGAFKTIPSFNGIFIGDSRYVNNLVINSLGDYVGIFGKNTGTIKGLNIENISVTGNNYVGALTGFNDGTITSIMLTGTINANDYVGGLVGSNNSGKIDDVIVNVEVNANKIVGLIAGYANKKDSVYAKTTGIASGKLNTKDTSYKGILVGRRNYGTCLVEGLYGNVEYTINGETQEIPSSNFDTVYTNNLYDQNMLGNHIDLISNGDEDSDGYYFEFENNKLVLRSIERKNIINSLEGKGTKESPYLIYNFNDMLTASRLSNESKYFKLMSNLDYKNEKFYKLGSTSRPFNGVFDGNGYTLKNIVLNGEDNIGMFVDNKGTIKGLNIENISVTGNNYVGALTGFNEGTIMSVIVKGDITGNNYVGGITGKNFIGKIDDAIVNVEVIANTYGSLITGFASFTYKSDTGYLYSNNSGIGSGVLNINDNYVGPLFAKIDCGTNRTSGLYSDVVLYVNGVTKEVSATNGNAKLVDDLYNIEILKSYIDLSSDINNDGYYFTLNENNNFIISKN